MTFSRHYALVQSTCIFLATTEIGVIAASHSFLETAYYSVLYSHTISRHAVKSIRLQPAICLKVQLKYKWKNKQWQRQAYCTYHITLWQHQHHS